MSQLTRKSIFIPETSNIINKSYKKLKISKQPTLSTYRQLQAQTNKLKKLNQAN